MQENKRKQEHPHHHGERTDIIRIGTGNEPLVLRVLKWSDGDLCRAIKVCVSDAIIVHFELIDSVNVRDLEVSFVDAVGLVLQSRPDKRIDSNKLQLDVVGLERLPLVAFEDFNFDGVHLWIESQKWLDEKCPK